MADNKIRVVMDDMTLGDMEQLEEASASGSIREMLKVFDRVIKIEGVAQEDIPATIRSWKISEMAAIAEAIKNEVAAQTNPVVNEKN